MADVQRPRLLFIAFLSPRTRASGVCPGKGHRRPLGVRQAGMSLSSPRRVSWFATTWTRQRRSAGADCGSGGSDRAVSCSRMAWGRGPAPLWGGFMASFQRLPAKWRRWWGETVPEPAPLGSPAYHGARALELHRRSPFDVVLATCNPCGSFCCRTRHRRGCLGAIRHQPFPRLIDNKTEYTEAQPAVPARRRKPGASARR